MTEYITTILIVITAILIVESIKLAVRLWQPPTPKNAPISIDLDAPVYDIDPLLECEECGARFVLIAFYDDKSMAHESFEYCPYCGAEGELP